MKMEMFAVLDLKAKFFGNPFFESSTESALRAFTDAVNDRSNQNNMWSKHPEDFQLYKIGEYDNLNAKIDPIKPEPIVMGTSVKQVTEKDIFPTIA